MVEGSQGAKSGEFLAIRKLNVRIRKEDHQSKTEVQRESIETRDHHAKRNWLRD